MYQPYLKTDWRHGFGFLWDTDALGYLRTDGNVDTRQGGMVMLMTTSVSSDTANQPKQGFATFNSAAYSWGTGGGGISGVRKFTTSWADQVDDGAADYGTVNYVLGTNGYLFVCPDGDRIQKITTGGTVTDTGVNASSTDYKWLCIHQGYIYAGKDASALVFRDDNETLSGLAGDVADDPDYMLVGGGRYPTIGAISYLGRLLVTTQEGIYQMGDDLIARKVLDYSNQASSANFRSIALHNNRIVYAVRDNIYTWNGSTVNPITPRQLTEDFPYVTYGRFDNFVEVGDFLYLTARTNQTTYEEHLLCWDGVGWHKMMDLVTNGTDTVTGMGYDVVNNYLWIHVQAAAANTTYYVRFQNQSYFPYGNFPTSGTHSLITSRLAMGFHRIEKSTPSIIVEADNCTTTRYLVLYWSLDGGDWHEWGGSGNGRITQDGTFELFSPRGEDGGTLEYNYMQLRVDFVTADATQSPVLEGITTRFIMRPKTLWGYHFTIMASDYQRIGASRRNMSTAKQIMDNIKAARASSKPVYFQDPIGDEHWVYITSVEGRAISRTPKVETGGSPEIERVISVNLIELG